MLPAEPREPERGRRASRSLSLFTWGISLSLSLSLSLNENGEKTDNPKAS